MSVATIDSSAARKAMIDSQLRPSGVNDEWLLAAMGSVPREDFVPAGARGHAYIDRAVPLGDGHALPAPLFHGRMLSEAAPRRDDRILVVSCGSDYLAALLRTLDVNVTVVSAADAAAGVKGTFSLILIDGAIEQLPAALAAALDEGGRIVTGMTQRGVTRLSSGRKIGGAVALVPLVDMGIPVLAEFAAPKSWSF
ncbi:protein-L-isoaspartate O-methyltransferase [Novosphingobium aquiterrae]|uniref:Protein-L-isoaspartate O-methyltransferase n=1 Tax=Novosphingobium aquiterrae TaxID=624388 RepID=A0ABV6PJ25_9SPHN